DNVSYSMRSLKDGELTCFYGDDRWLIPPRPCETGLATAYGFATIACGFRMQRHEGKLTGLAAYGEPKLADAIGRHFKLGDDGVIRTDFKDWRKMWDAVMDSCKGQPRETIAASIQKVAEDFTAAAVQYWLKRTGARRLALAGGLFANVRLNRL